MDVPPFQTKIIAGSPITCEINFPKLINEPTVNMLDINCHIWALLIGDSKFPLLHGKTNFRENFYGSGKLTDFLGLL